MRFFQKRRWTLLLLAVIPGLNIEAQDSIPTLQKISITGYRIVNGIGHFNDFKSGIIYAGKKNEVIIIDSLDANKAINNTRQILGRIPGLNIVETESSGFTANGIATRGLNPIQSIEMNTRQNGYNISADIYGYNEAYYLPPMEAVSRIEMIRGAAALQFGAQFGGMVNYVIRDAPAKKPLEFNTSQTIGSYGMFNTYNSLGGTYKKHSYFGFFQYRTMEGYRPNSRQWQLSGYGKYQYAFSPKWTAGLEYSALRNKIQMPGGLTDSMFLADPKTSTRSRNWLTSPWNILAAYANFTPSPQTSVSLKVNYLFSSRSLVWRNEDGGPAAPDDIDPVTNEYVSREVGIEKMRNITTELRISHEYAIGKLPAVLAGGLRFSHATFSRQGGGEGTTGSDFDLSITGEWGYDLDFTTTNLAPFAENIFRVGNHLTITPGFRMEFLNSTAKGYKTEDMEKILTDQGRSRYFPLFGLGMEYKPTRNTAIYGNISQAYRPIDYAQLEPFGTTSRIDPGLKDANGYNADLGYRGIFKNFLNVDISGFYMAYNDRIGTILKTDPQTGEEYTLRTNVANSVHKGIESYLEFNILKFLRPASRSGLSIFHSYSFIDARYTTGEYKGNRVEAAARSISRLGMVFSVSGFSATMQMNRVGDAYGDATNARVSEDPVAGYIPAYTVFDLSASYKRQNYTFRAGVNNLGNASYFTRRTDEYPGPGIIPSTGRSLYLGFSVKF